MSVSKKELIEECAELRVAKSELEDAIKRLHGILSMIEDDSYEIDHSRSMHFRGAKSLLEYQLEKIGREEIVTFS